jgi:hypothetical protein
VERERGEKVHGGSKNREGDLFFVDFEPGFLLPRTMKSTPIYRGWKKNMLSFMVPNLGPKFSWEGS